MRTRVVSGLISLCLVMSISQEALALPLQHGDFSSFSGWDAEIYNGSFYTPVDPATDTHFNLLGSGRAELSTDQVYYELILAQEFDLPSNVINLSFDFAWSLTDPLSDFVQATLIDPFTFDYLDLFPGTVDFSLATNSGTATTDISVFAGQTMLLEFFLQDGGDNNIDRFSIGNVELQLTSVPEPGSLLLFGTGLIALVFGFRRTGRCQVL